MREVSVSELEKIKELIKAEGYSIKTETARTIIEFYDHEEYDYGFEEGIGNVKGWRRYVLCEITCNGIKELRKL